MAVTGKGSRNTTGKDGKKKANVTREQLKASGLTLGAYLNQLDRTGKRPGPKASPAPNKGESATRASAAKSAVRTASKNAKPLTGGDAIVAKGNARKASGTPAPTKRKETNPPPTKSATVGTKAKQKPVVPTSKNKGSAEGDAIIAAGNKRRDAAAKKKAMDKQAPPAKSLRAAPVKKPKPKPKPKSEKVLTDGDAIIARGLAKQKAAAVKKKTKSYNKGRGRNI
jgi:hypothetical protein